MTIRYAIGSVVVSTAFVALQLSALAQRPPDPGPGAAARDGLTFNTATGQRIRVTTVADGLVHPFSKSGATPTFDCDQVLPS